MSRAGSVSQQRGIPLTEELEKLEQSITLTLQEIDHNFSRAHRIVTTSILPIVEQYTEHSRQVWEGSRFWKQFFESSANVSLSGYEEQPSSHEPLDETVTEESSSSTHPSETSESYETPSSQNYSASAAEDEIDLSGLTISPSQSTPRATAIGAKKVKPSVAPAFADYPSPYETLRQEISVNTNPTDRKSTREPQTPGKSPAVVNQSKAISMTPGSSPYLPPGPTSIPRPSTIRKKTDPLLHRVLDRNYRVQATPLATGRYGNLLATKSTVFNNTTTPATAKKAKLFESMLSSSPEMPAAPQLHAEVFSSPVRGGGKSRTPGVSVLTPGKPPRSAGGTIWDSDDDFDDSDDKGLPFGQSPPKTMQFHVPQSRLLKTPAKEASKRIVEDILTTAGIDVEDDLTDEFDDGYGLLEENSPSVIRKAADLEDESF